MDIMERNATGKKLRKAIERFCSFIEIILAMLAGVSLLVSLVLYVLSAVRLVQPVFSTEEFSLFLNDIFVLVVGVEFIQMLLKPSVDNVIEVLVFLVTRNLILSHSSALDMLGSVVCILLLYSFHFALHFLMLRYPGLARSMEYDASHIGNPEEADEYLTQGQEDP